VTEEVNGEERPKREARRGLKFFPRYHRDLHRLGGRRFENRVDRREQTLFGAATLCGENERAGARPPSEKRLGFTEFPARCSYSYGSRRKIRNRS